MDIKRIISNTLKIVMPLALGGTILYWMYRGFDFKSIKNILLNEMNWTWMILSFPFGILAQMFRGWRWRQTLSPIGEHPRTYTAINSIFISYAVSLVIPRIGEFMRCVVLKKHDGVSFPKALGTVVTERVIDSLLVAIVTGLTLLIQMRMFSTFFSQTGTSMNSFFSRFSTTGYIVTAICGLAALILLHFLLKKLSLYERVKTTLSGIWQGIISLKNVKNIPLFLFYTIAIWVCYFLHYYLTFFCFEFTANLGLQCALVTFVVGSIAVIVPTPNGAGPWHFAVKTMLILYGISDVNALYFVLIVHTVQTLLVIILGIYGCNALAFTDKLRKNK
ncbi:MAG: flippase-like domain-containing protein [Prevotella sp.]|nr:flippase-like domain-containing protein [Prevotella sp.]